MVEGTCLENRRAGNGTEGSNPSLSARRGALKHLLGRFSSCEVKGFGSQVRWSTAEMGEVRYPSSRTEKINQLAH